MSYPCTIKEIKRKLREEVYGMIVKDAAKKRVVEVFRRPNEYS